MTSKAAPVRRSHADLNYHCTVPGCSDISLCEACYRAIPFPAPQPPVVRKRGRPRVYRSLLSTAAVTYADITRREREHHRRYLAERMDDTAAAADEGYWLVRMASLALEPYGIRLVPNDRVLHIHMDWPKSRRQVSGSVWDGRKLIWRRPMVATLWQIPMRPIALNLTRGPKVKCAHRSWKSAAQQKACKRDNRIEPYGADDAAAAAFLTAVGHLATPLTKRAQSYLAEGTNKEITTRRDQSYEVPAWWGRAKYWQGALPCPEWLLKRVGGYVTKVPRCTGAYSLTEWPLDYIAAPVFAEELGGKSQWFEAVIPERIFKVGTGNLKHPDIGSDNPFKGAARLWNWRANYLRRLRLNSSGDVDTFPSECARLDRSTPITTDAGGQCCRWTCGGFKTCPLQCWRRARKPVENNEE